MMKDESTPPRSTREQALDLAYELVRRELAGIADIEAQCRKSGARYEAPARAVLDYLGRAYVITVPDASVALLEGGEEAPLKDKVLLLQYFTKAEGTPLSGRLITFKQLPGCASYAPVFDLLATNPIVGFFGSDPDRLVDAAEKLGGRRAGHADVSVVLNLFSRVPFTVALWRGDDEFDPRGTIMFDSTITDYLSIEGIRDVGGAVARRLISLAKQ